MSRALRLLGRVYLILAAAVLPAAAGAALLLAVAVPAEGRFRAWQALTGRAPLAEGEAEARFHARRRQELDDIARRRDEDFRARQAALDDLDRMARATLSRAAAERQEAERLRAAAAPGGPFDANVELLNRVEPATAVALMRSWEDAANSAYLRALRPSRAAEIVDLLAADPAFKERLPRILGKP